MLLHRLIHLIRLEAGGKVMLRLNNINLDKSPELIQPPKIDDNIVCVKLIPDMNDIISPDIIDVALSYSIAGIEVVLEIPFENRAEFENQQLASIISNGGWSLSLWFSQNYALLNHAITDTNQQLLYSIHFPILYFFYWVVVTTKTIRHLK
jgi:hypothetical protein